MGGVPAVNVSQNTAYMRIRKIGKPQSRWITISSIRSEAVCRISIVDRTVSWHTPEMKP